MVRLFNSTDLITVTIMATPYPHGIQCLNITLVSLAKVGRLKPSKLEPSSCQDVNTLLLVG